MARLSESGELAIRALPVTAVGEAWHAFHVPQANLYYGSTGVVVWPTLQDSASRWTEECAEVGSSLIPDRAVVDDGQPHNRAVESPAEETRHLVGLELFRKANALLGLLERGGEWSAQELADGAGEPVSSTYRMLTSLREIGLVEKGLRRGRFRLGLYAMNLGAVCDDRLSLRGVATHWLEWLQTETTATSFLMLRRGYSAVCIDRVVGKGVRSLALRLGGSLPLHAGAGPRALLAYLPEAERRAVLEHFDKQSETDPDVPTRRQLQRMIDEIRETGVSMSDEDVTPGIAAVGAPVFNHRGELEAAISVSTMRVRLLQDRERTVRLVLQAAEAISRGMGYRDVRWSA